MYEATPLKDSGNVQEAMALPGDELEVKHWGSETLHDDRTWPPTPFDYLDKWRAHDRPILASPTETPKRLEALVNASSRPEPDGKIKKALAKPDLALIPKQSLVGVARVFSYGAKKYAPGNFYQAHLEDGAGRRYLSAVDRHLMETGLPNGLHTYVTLAALDEESGLPHIDHAICSLLMLRSIITKSGALPMDPGPGKDPQ